MRKDNINQSIIDSLTKLVYCEERLAVLKKSVDSHGSLSIGNDNDDVTKGIWQLWNDETWYTRLLADAIEDVKMDTSRAKLSLVTVYINGKKHRFFAKVAIKNKKLVVTLHSLLFKRLKHTFYVSEVGGEGAMTIETTSDNTTWIRITSLRGVLAGVVTDSMNLV